MTTHTKSRDAGFDEFISAGVVLADCEKLIRSAAEDGMADVMRVNLKKREGGWLLILEATINGERFVQFRDLGNLQEMPKALKSALENPAWKVSRPVRTTPA
jgi:hypothetical protein